jgi:hypothetical protein
VILPGPDAVILEKPSSKADQLSMLERYSGQQVLVATGVTIGESYPLPFLPILHSHPAYSPTADRYSWLRYRFSRRGD